MKKLVVVTAFALAGFTVSAAACDWNCEVSNGPTVVADCTGADCKRYRDAAHWSHCDPAGLWLELRRHPRPGQRRFLASLRGRLRE